MNFLRIIRITALAAGCLPGGMVTASPAPVVPQPVAFDQIQIQGELGVRLARNFNRLEEAKYQPDHVFLTLKQSGNWPGDTEGRTILGLTLDAQATHRDPKYLEEILRRLPSNLNSNGFFGNIPPAGLADEQQLAGHGWVLRGLCEYYLWKHDSNCLAAINRIVDNLVLPTKGLHARYPVDPTKRVHGGGASGTPTDQLGSWIVSTDIGCDFIFLDGVVQAYQVTGRKELKPVIDEMVGRFLEIDLRAIKAQTHASLTALRALLRYYEITGDAKLLPAVVERFELYRRSAMTENYENYNWFGRPESTEPCAVVDSYMVAMGLWRLTGKIEYAALAEHIYYNALAFEQRANGGFGTQKCSGEDNPFVTVGLQEAHWCCTMRGAEGLARVAQACFYTDPEGLYVMHFNEATVKAKLGSLGTLELREETDYPFGGQVRFIVAAAELSAAVELRLFSPPWTSHPSVRLNGNLVKVREENGFIRLQQQFQTGDIIEYSFKLHSGSMPMEGTASHSAMRKLYYGPLLLGCAPKSAPALPESPKPELLPDHTFRVAGLDEVFGTVYHLLDPRVGSDPRYQVQMLFKSNPGMAGGPTPSATVAGKP